MSGDGKNVSLSRFDFEIRYRQERWVDAWVGCIIIKIRAFDERHTIGVWNDVVHEWNGYLRHEVKGWRKEPVLEQISHEHANECSNILCE